MRSRSLRLAGQAVRLALFAIFGVIAVRFFSDTLLDEGWTPRTFFALLVLTGAVSLVWRAALDVAKIARKTR
jgi:multisubunit Na+/H+ antiporter MnhE subunit